ncbi:MAG TPA: C39 family peptidase [Labilithrix sp.]|jgi:uncharacterized protein YvpB|nr:C39 family peptidase [Labilithrix sp.]
MPQARVRAVALLVALAACSENPSTAPSSATQSEGSLGAGTNAYVEGTQADGTEGGLALRAGPSTSHAMVLVIPEGARVHVTGQATNDFTPITHAGHAGWVHTEYLDPADRGGMVVDVPWIAQNPELPRGCEVTSLAMLLAHAGVAADKMTLAGQIDKVPYDAGNGLRGNPNDGFVGDMYTFAKAGYGVYHAPVRRLAESYLPSLVVDLTGASFDDVLDQHVGQGRPVWVIANAKFRELPPSAFETWKTSSGDVRITWHEHSVVVVGYDSHSVFINDPLDPKGKNKPIKRASFRAAWEQMGSQAIAYMPSP